MGFEVKLEFKFPFMHSQLFDLGQIACLQQVLIIAYGKVE